MLHVILPGHVDEPDVLINPSMCAGPHNHRGGTNINDK